MPIPVMNSDANKKVKLCLMISMHWRRVTSTTLNLKRDHLCKSEVGQL